jgi:hypothetical protein
MFIIIQLKHLGISIHLRFKMLKIEIKEKIHQSYFLFHCMIVKRGLLLLVERTVACWPDAGQPGQNKKLSNGTVTITMIR